MIWTPWNRSRICSYCTTKNILWILYSYGISCRYYSLSIKKRSVEIEKVPNRWIFSIRLSLISYLNDLRALKKKTMKSQYLMFYWNLQSTFLFPFYISTRTGKHYLKKNNRRSSALTCKQTRMTTFIKAKLKKSDDQTNIDKYRVAANITEYHMISKWSSLIIRNYHYKIHGNYFI